MGRNGARVSLELLLIVLSIKIGVSNVSSSFTSSACQCEDFPIGDKPFVALWNSPTGGCQKNFSVAIDLKGFDIIANEQQTWNGKYVTVFYNAQLGYYPYFTDSKGLHSYNGGMPQLVNLDLHLKRSERDIIARIPDPQYKGLAVIDWEGWRPVWERNWDSKKIYQTRSVEIARLQYPDWPLDKLVELAKSQFEDSSRRLMEATLKLARTIRPYGKWGFYGFPDCYGSASTGYKCSEEHEQMNDRLYWMYDVSSAMFPSIYLMEKKPSNRAFVRGRLMETLRQGLAQAMSRGHPVPVFPYFRFIYEKNFLDYEFLTDEDLKNTIGQASDLGAAGIVMWGNRRDENTSPEICRKINHYIKTKLGPYYHKLQKTAEKCSEAKCGGNGWCIKGVTSVGVDVNQNRMLRHSCPGVSRTFTPTKKPHFRTMKKGSRKGNAVKYENRIEAYEKDVSEVLEQGLGHHDNKKHKANRTSNGTDGTSRSEIPTEMVYCNKTTIGTTKCILVKGHTSAELTKHNNFHMPKIYAVLISISLGGALVLSTVYIGTYYYFNIYKKQKR